MFDGQGNLYGVTQIGPLNMNAWELWLRYGVPIETEWGRYLDGVGDSRVQRNRRRIPDVSPIFDSLGNLYGTTDGQGGAGHIPMSFTS